MNTSENSKTGWLGKVLGFKSPHTQESPDKDTIQNWIVEKLATYLEVPAEEIDVHQPFSDYGIDSRTAISLSGDLERWLNRQLSPTLVWDFPTVEEVAKHLADENQQNSSSSSDNVQPAP